MVVHQIDISTSRKPGPAVVRIRHVFPVLALKTDVKDIADHREDQNEKVEANSANVHRTCPSFLPSGELDALVAVDEDTSSDLKTGGVKINYSERVNLVHFRFDQSILTAAIRTAKPVFFTRRPSIFVEELGVYTHRADVKEEPNGSEE